MMMTWGWFTAARVYHIIVIIILQYDHHVMAIIVCQVIVPSW
jgi:hypothetical protein